jgi:hypothetical protein
LGLLPEKFQGTKEKGASTMPEVKIFLNWTIGLFASFSWRQRGMELN